MDADFVIFDPEKAWTVGPYGKDSRAILLPYYGWELVGHIESTWIRGTKVWDGSNFLVDPGFGTFIKRH